MFAALSLLLFLVVFTQSPLLAADAGRPWMTLVVTFGAIPLLDALLGARAVNPFAATPPALARWIPRAQLPLQAALLLQALMRAPTLAGIELLWFALAVGTVTGGIGITVAHELGHRASRFDRAIARALLVSVCYGHFQVEHIRGHHVRVGTPDDPATAPRGMPVYRFVPRSVAGSFVHAWQLERLRLAARGRRTASAANWVLTGSALSLLLALAAFAAAGAAGLLLFIGQAVTAVVLLEIINYIEHYGLQRAHRGARYEPVEPRHSWNADFTFSNWLLFGLQLHSDHHAHMQRPYEALRPMAQAPQLPAGYPAMVMLALVPPLWFALMDARLPQPRGAA